MFLEAVAGDVRSSISTSPRITLQNGQTATLTVSDNLENQITGVQFAQMPNGGYVMQPTFSSIPAPGLQAVATPSNDSVQNNINLSLQAVITADRRFVRLTPNLQLTGNQAAGTAQPNAPVLIPIYPVPPGTGISEGPVVYSQFIQQPRITTISINTTVTVPDGGTVVLGGLKRMSEGRNEYGPPVLSQIPYIDRLFRNVAYGRSATSILVMVTPRIIIQEEEEERATGFRVAGEVGAVSGRRIAYCGWRLSNVRFAKPPAAICLQYTSEATRISDENENAPCRPAMAPSRAMSW